MKTSHMANSLFRMERYGGSTEAKFWVFYFYFFATCPRQQMSMFGPCSLVQLAREGVDPLHFSSQTLAEVKIQIDSVQTIRPTCQSEG